ICSSAPSAVHSAEAVTVCGAILFWIARWRGVMSFLCASVLSPPTAGHGADAPQSPIASCRLTPVSCLLSPVSCLLSPVSCLLSPVSCSCLLKDWAGRPETERPVPRRGDSRSLPVVCDCGSNHHFRRP